MLDLSTILAYAIFTTELDQVVYNEKTMLKEFNDLKKMGLDNIRVLLVEGTNNQEAIDEMDRVLRETSRLGRKTMNKVSDNYGVKITFLKHHKES